MTEDVAGEERGATPPRPPWAGRQAAPAPGPPAVVTAEVLVDETDPEDAAPAFDDWPPPAYAVVSVAAWTTPASAVGEEPEAPAAPPIEPEPIDTALVAEGPGDPDPDDDLMLGGVALALGEGPPPVPADLVPEPAQPDDPDPDDDDLILGGVALAMGDAPPVPADLVPEPAPPDDPDDDGDVLLGGVALAPGDGSPPLPVEVVPEPDAAPAEDSLPAPPADEVPVAAMAADAGPDEADDFDGGEAELLRMWANSTEESSMDAEDPWRRRLWGPVATRWSAMRRGERVNVVLYVLTGISIVAMTAELLAGPDAIPTDVTTTPSAAAAQSPSTVKSTTTVTFTLPQPTEPAPVVTRAPSRAPAPVATDPEPVPEPTTEPEPDPEPTPRSTPPPTTRPVPMTTATTFPNTFPTPVPPVPPSFPGPTVPTVTSPSKPAP